jgi:hypothetical protein
MKCLQRDPTHRYATAAALSDDLQNWLEGRRVSARPPSMTSVLSEMFYNNLRSAIGASVIGVVAGLLFGVGIFTFMTVENFGVGKDFDLGALYDALPSMKRQELLLSAVPEEVYVIGFFGAVFVYLFTGLVLERLVRPKTIREMIALSLVAGMFMTVTDFASAMGNLLLGADILSRQADEIRQLTDASLLSGQEHEKALRTFFDRLPELNDYSPQQQSELLAKSITVRTAIVMAKWMWASLLLTSSICLISCVAGGIHAFRLRSVESRFWRILIPYLEVMLLSIFLLGLLAIEFVAVFGIESTSGQTVPPFAASRMLRLAIVIVAIVPGLLLWQWYWRWMVYALAAAMFWWSIT